MWATFKPAIPKSVVAVTESLFGSIPARALRSARDILPPVFAREAGGATHDREKRKRYDASDQGKARDAQYDASEKGAIRTATGKTVQREAAAAVADKATAENDAFMAQDMLYRSTGLCEFSDPATLCEEISRQIVSPEQKSGLVKAFNAVWDRQAWLLACAACGMRDYDTPPGSHYKQVGMSRLGCLELTQGQAENLDKIDPAYRAAISYFTAPDGRRYHLHPELVAPGANLETGGGG
jgi:hypothetical protein